MSLRGEWRNKLRYFGRRPRFDTELDDEIRFHLETRAAELEQAGLSRAVALMQARREFGPVARASEESRSAWQFRWIEDLGADLRFALRSFRRTPGFALTAVLSLALGIGANSTIFTALDTVLWKPLPVAHPETLINLSISRANGPNETDLPVAFVPQLADARVFDDLIVTIADGLSFSDGDRAERIVGEAVSPNFFNFLSVQPILGQGFTPEVQAGRWAPEAVLSYSFWQRRFRGDPNVVGRTIRLNTYPFTIVGVSPRSFCGLVRGSDYELRIPILPPGREISQMQLIKPTPGQWIVTTARLKPGANVSQAQAAADAQLQAFLRTTSIARFRNASLRHLHLSPGARGDYERVRSFQTPLFILLILVAIVLLIACANVASMLLARATARTREIAIRASIGAGRLRLIRQMIAESVLLSLLGGIMGLVIAYWAAGALNRFVPQGHINLALDLRPDTRALLFTFALSLLTGLVFGLVPALQSTRGDLASEIKTGSAGSIGERSSRFRKLLVTSQVAFSLLLLIAAGVFIRTLSALRPADFRSDPARVLLFTMKPQQELYTDQRRRLLAAELIGRISALPGVQSAALAESGPLSSRAGSGIVEVPGRSAIRAESDTVSPGFFETVGIPLVAGRDFSNTDTAASLPVVIISQTLARTLFPGETPLGKMLKVPTGRADRNCTVIGVAADTHYYDVHKPPQPVVWFAMQQFPPYMPTLHVRTRVPDTAGMIPSIRREFDLLDKGFPIFNVRTLQLRIDDSLANERMVATLSGAFGLLALSLAAVGLYGILAYSVSRRTREIGIRMALGSSSGSVLWMVAAEALRLVAAGTLAGAALAFASTRLASRYVAGLASLNPAIFITCALTMLVLTAVAVSIPALRACRVDPLTALRHD